MKRAAVAFTVVVTVILGGMPAAWADDHDIKGTFTLIDSAINAGGGLCEGSGGYDDLGQTTQVVVRDGKSKILATTKLGRGRMPSNGRGVTCLWKFTLKDVPESDFYSFEVSHRGELTYSAKELEKKKWRVAFSIS